MTIRLIKNGKRFLEQGSHRRVVNMDIDNYETVKRAFGNIVYTQKTIEKAIDRKECLENSIKITNIILVMLVLLSIFLQMIYSGTKWPFYVGIIITLLEIFFLFFQLSFNPSKDIVEHKKSASELWFIREQYINLMTDIKNTAISTENVINRRNELTKQTYKIYANMPRTISKDYLKANKSLNTNEKPVADNNELRHFLPEHLNN